MMFLFPIAIVLIVYFVMGDKLKQESFVKKSPENILKERFVNGEIDEATYLQMLGVLKNN